MGIVGHGERQASLLLQCPTMYELKANDLGTLTVLNAEQEVISIDSLWADQTAVLVFVRHFG
jgi:hypothetical protein